MSDFIFEMQLERLSKDFKGPPTCSRVSGSERKFFFFSPAAVCVWRDRSAKLL